MTATGRACPLGRSWDSFTGCQKLRRYLPAGVPGPVSNGLRTSVVGAGGTIAVMVDFLVNECRSGALRVVSRVVLRQQVLAVVIAIGLTHDGVDVKAFRLLVVEEDPRVVVVLDEQHRRMHAVVEGARVAVPASPDEPGLVEVVLDLAPLQPRVTCGHPVDVDVDQVEQQLLLARAELVATNTLVRQDEVVLPRAGEVAAVERATQGRRRGRRGRRGARRGRGRGRAGQAAP